MSPRRMAVFSHETADLAGATRNAAGYMVILRQRGECPRTCRYRTGSRYTLSVIIAQGNTTPGTSSAPAIDPMKQLAAATLAS